MNQDRLLVHYERIADAPDAIARLRRFILDLAVRGKLVPQDSNDGPAINFDRAIPGDLERPFEIPRAWNWARLHTLGKLKGGGTPSKARNDFWNGNIPWVSPKDMKVGHIAEAQMSISEAAIAGSAANLIEAGSVLFVVRGMILAHSFPVAISRVPLAINQDMKALVLKKPEMAEFILRALRGIKPEVMKRVQRSSHGTCRLEGSDYSDFLIPIPPVTEQRRIVAKVDELMALCLNALPALTTRPDQIKQLRQTILNLAVRGKLVEQAANDEPASELLKRIAKDKARLVQDREIRQRDIQPPIAPDDAPFDLPNSWVWTRLGTLCFLITDGAHHTPKYQEKGVPFLSVKDVSGGTIDFANTRFISEEAHRELAKRCNPEFGDILLTKVGTTGIAVEVNTETEFSVFVSLALLKISRENIDQKFLCHLINSPFVKRQSADNTQGIGNKNLVLRLINQFAVPLPPLAEQHRIVAKVDALMALCDRLEASLTASAATRRRLLDALLAEALTPVADRELEAAE